MNKYKKPCITLLIFSLLLVFSSLFAEEKPSNSESEQKPVPVWKDNLNISLGIQYLQTATKVTTMNYGFKYGANFQDVWNLSMNIGGSYGKSQGVITQNEHKMELTTDRWLYQVPLSITCLGSVETNETSLIYVRSIAGIGLKWKPVNKWWLELSFSIDPIVEYTRPWDMSIDDSKNTIMKTQNGIDLIFAFKEDKSKTLSISSKYFLNFKDSKEYRTETNITLSLGIYGILKLDTTFKHDYTAVLPGGNEGKSVPKNNYSLITAFSIDLQK